MEINPVNILVAVCAAIMILVIRIVIQRKKEARKLEEDLNKYDLFPTRQDLIESDVFEEPEEQRFIPDDEIEKYSDEHEKESARVFNYLIRNEIKNLDKIEFFDLQERILLFEFGDSVNNFKVEHIYQVAENRFVAMIRAGDEKNEAEDPGKDTEIQIMGIIRCQYSLGNGRLQPYKYTAEIPDPDILYPETEIRIGNHLLFPEGYVESTKIEVLCKEIDKLKTDYVAFIDGETVYIRITRYAALTDLKTMIEILMNYQY
jgi:hypothetical protein